MATNFPASLDVLTNPTPTTSMSGSLSHAGQHSDLNDAVEALQAKVGADSSAVTSSHDYKIAALEAASTGKILQVVYGSTSTQVASSTTTFADTGLSVSITPSSTSSNVLVLINQNGLYRTSADRWTGIKAKLLRDSTDLSEFGLAGYTETITAQSPATLSLSYLDSPSTTSAVTYKTQFANTVSAGTIYVQYNNGRLSTIVALEVSA